MKFCIMRGGVAVMGMLAVCGLAAEAPVARLAPPAFEGCEIEVRGIFFGRAVFTITGEGMLRYELSNARGKNLAEPYRATYRLSEAHTAEFVRLLEGTQWLKAPRPKGMRATDQNLYTFKLERTKGGPVTTLQFEDTQEGAYGSLILFLRRVEHQENLLFQLKEPDRSSLAIHLLADEMESMAGAANRQRPNAPVLDYGRLAEVLLDRVSRPVGFKTEEVKLAAEILGRMRWESARGALEGLALEKPVRGEGGVTLDMRRGAVRGLGLLGAQPSLGTLEKLIPENGVGDELAAAIAAVQPRESMRLLGMLAETNQEAAWQLVSVGLEAEPLIMELLKRAGNDANTTAAGTIIRAYADHWEAARRPTAAILTAIRERTKAAVNGSNTQVYGKRVLELAGIAAP